MQPTRSNSGSNKAGGATEPTAAIKVGVMGGASDVGNAEHMARAHALGRAIAAHGCVLVTGACPGLPLAAACGAKEGKGLVIGISPALNRDEHVRKYESPTAFHDVLIFTGSGLMGREVINIRTSDIVVIAGGRSGTLGELAIAYDEGKLIGVLTGMGGISDLVKDILTACAKDTGARAIYDPDPERLVGQLLTAYSATGTPKRPTAPHADPIVLDPVCGMRILPAAAAAQRVTEGRPVWFCSLACAKRFDADPTHFAGTAVSPYFPSAQPPDSPG